MRRHCETVEAVDAGAVTKSSQDVGAVVLTEANNEGSNVVMLANGAAGVNNTIVLGNGKQLKSNQLIGRYGEKAGSATPNAAVFQTSGANGQRYLMGGAGDDNVAWTTNRVSATISRRCGADLIVANNGTLAGGEVGATLIRGCHSRIAWVRSPEEWKSIPSCTTVRGLSQYVALREIVSLQYLARFAANQNKIHNESLAA